jgi:hypothetical protein
MRFVALILAAFGVIAAAPPEADMVKFNQALADGRRGDAFAVVDKFLRERDLGTGKPQSDPVLNALIGRAMLASREPANAAIYLDRAPLTQLPGVLRAPTALDHARVLELTGQRSRALTAFEEAAGLSSGALRRAALYGQARLTLASDPTAVRRLLVAAGEPGAADRWEQEFLQSAAHSLLGDPASAQRAAALSWQHSADAPREAQAPLNAAVLRAGLAAAGGDISTERAMLQVSNGLDLRPSASLTGQLPACGDEGVKPDDYVTFAALSAPYLGWRLVPVSASRVAVIHTFADAIGTASPFRDQGRAPVGTVFTVRCRSALASAAALREPADPLLTWLVDHGAYQATFPKDSEPADINAVADRIDLMSTRLGSHSPLLIGPRWQLMTMLMRSAATGEEVQPGQVLDLASAIADGMRSEGAPAWLSRIVTAQFDMAKAQQAAARDPAAASTFFAKLQEAILDMPFGMGRYLLGVQAGSQPELSDAISTMVIALNGQKPADLLPRERQAWLVAVAEAQRTLGRDAEARATIKSAGLAPDLCLAAESEPKLLEQHFSYSDYPDDLIAGEQEGLSTFDFSLTNDGKVASQRVILSFPANIFDAVSAKGLATVRYSVPKRNGRSAGCRGLVQPIIWRLEDNNEIAPIPLFRKGVLAPTT